MSMFISKLHSARRSTQEQIQKQQAFHSTLRARAQELKQYFEMFPPSMRKDVYVQAESYDSTVRMGLSLRYLDSFKDKKLTRLLEKFADWEAVSQDYTFGDQPNRDFIFTHQTPFGVRIKVSIYAYVKSDSPLCRVVVKGTTTRVVEEEIREIVCE
jgi:hypothetical protein